MTQPKRSEQSKEKTRARNRKARARERFEVKYYRELKDKVKNTTSMVIPKQDLIDYFEEVDKLFNQWYRERYENQ
jgi:spore cortex formation protein SpoVR/YcgB (stage V sporulation)